MSKPEKMMRVKMLTSYAAEFGPGFSAGKVYTMPIKKAEQLIEAKFALPEHVCSLEIACLRILEAGGTIESPPENEELLTAVAGATAAYERGVTSKPILEGADELASAAEEKLDTAIKLAKGEAEAEAVETKDGKPAKTGAKNKTSSKSKTSANN